MKIYTKKGDKGETRLFNNECVSKDSWRVEAYGAIDELNSIIGSARAQKLSKNLDKILAKTQNDLFVLGSDLATPISAKLGRKIPRIKNNDVLAVERAIDQLDEKLPPLGSFILPGGSMVGATLHIARTVCRRAERIAVKLGKQEKISSVSLKYLNRLSDLLFVLARTANHEAKTKEMIWKVK